MTIPEAEQSLQDYRDTLRIAGVVRWAEELVKREKGAEAYLVGGAVRDRILGRPDTEDYDFVVRNVAPDALEAHLKKFGAVNYVGKLFGVYKLKLEGAEGIDALDVALPRTEHAWGTGKYTDVDTQSDPHLPLEEDLARRDFTVNALAARMAGDRSQSLVDNFGGLQDLAAKRLRTVGKPEERFTEDYSRTLRGLRFAAALGFECEPGTWAALTRTIPRLNDRDAQGERVIPAEVIAKEFLGALIASPVRAFDLYTESGGFAVLLPEVVALKGCPHPPEYHAEGDVWTHTRLALTALESAPFAAQFRESILTLTPQPLWNAEVALTVLLHDIGKPSTLMTPEKDGSDRIRFNDHDQVGAQMAGTIIDRLKLTSPEELGVDRARVHFLIRHHLLFLHGHADELRPATIEKYFFADPVRGEEFLKLCFADGAATIPAGGTDTLRDFRRMVARLNALKVKGRKTLPKPLLDGNEVMALLQLSPGKEVGEALRKLREAQLEGKVKTREEAAELLRSF
ncbi:hypothetical protein A3J43_01100 [Candidatus Uhrbacteria bacterium RIFCSPHIGHO2_12_FULL_54_23]|uniref:Poly A polymerase head domain-containing protein n=3 Tax=Candidatus Uhriibacteriota TaxID=1752732 RepID=A0A1F7UHJ4_9BACT|nr:MAG: hypothetical protein A3J43_01100 [Candidatus Uhrbacteria bacterium RIFCSPHIGHO2_12_FULL_54_23]OGL83654.1 MAG: hypothetical protein A3B36_00260 [Candidatus Uhrbacteria bacterium RIFCSPLOWO2_01_FULL_55_36]OGL89817.1 MAG: hypothetical protein A3J36_00300 [Candidatus Uhrbacteria bacterium RIFCSPLOWO2_02_FULL_54_37]